MTGKTFLFIHQNFPGQFVHVATELARLGHKVVALGIKGRAIPGVQYIRYTPKAPSRVSEVEQARDFETKVVRGLACAQAMVQLKQQGLTPDMAALCDVNVKIPMRGRADSLNLSVATGIMIYAATG